MAEGITIAIIWTALIVLICVWFYCASPRRENSSRAIRERLAHRGEG